MIKLTSEQAIANANNHQPTHIPYDPVTRKRGACWIDYGPFRISFACMCPMRREWRDDCDPFESDCHLMSLYRISLRNHQKASLYRPVIGGFKLAGFTNAEPLTIPFISVCLFDRLQIESNLL